MQPLRSGLLGRVLAGLVLVVLLIGSFVVAGATPGDPLEEEYPNEVEVTPSPDAYVGERVVLGGFVVETDPVVIATRASGYGRFTLVDANARLQNSRGPLEEGDRVTAFGTLEDDSTLRVERTVTREASEERYMYVASLLGGLWVAGRFVWGWRFDRPTIAFVPRDGGSATQDARGEDGQNVHGADGRDARDRSGSSTARSPRTPVDGGDRGA